MTTMQNDRAWTRRVQGRGRNRLSCWLGILGTVSLAACGGLDDGSGVDDSVVETASNALTLGCTTESVSGKMTVCVFRCDWSAPRSGNNWANCRVPTGYVLTGGGAEIEDNGTPGALIIGSYPASPYNLFTWQAESKSHQVTYTHRLRAYAIGLRIQGVSESTLRAAMVVRSQIAWGNNPAQEAFGNGEGIVIGGGARVVSAEAGNLLTRSMPTLGNGSWFAVAKDHGIPSWGMLETYAIVLTQQQFPGVPFLLVGRNLTLANCPSVNSGYGTATVNYSGPGVMVSIGAEALYNGSGRMLTDLYPSHVNSSTLRVTARSKDHLVADFGQTCPYAAVIELRTGTPGG